MDHRRLVPCADDIEAIRTLPTNVVPVYKPSKIIENIINKRRQKHEEALTDLRRKFRQINIATEEEVRFCMEDLTMQQNKYKEDAKAFLEGEIRMNHDNPTTLNSYIFEDVRHVICKLNDERIESCNYFYKSLDLLEQKRSRKFKEVLQDCYEVMLETYYKLPYELQSFFEHEILAMNQITLNNYRFYVELRYNFKLQIENDTRNWMFDITHYNDKFREAQRKFRLFALMEKEPPEIDNSQESISKEIVGEMYSIEAEDIVEYLGQFAKKLVSLYKFTIFKIFHRFFDDLQKFTESEIQKHQAEFTKIYEIQNDYYKPVIDEWGTSYGQEAEELQKLWDSITTSLKSNLKNTAQFLNQSSRLWDDHFRRINEVQKLVLQDVKDSITKHDRFVKIEENKLNIAVDKLRQEPNDKKLQISLKSTLKILDGFKRTYSKQFNAELKVLKKYSKLVDKETSLLLVEIDIFLRQNDPNLIGKYRSSNTNPAESSSRVVDRLMSDKMRICHYQISEVKNFTVCLWQAIKHYLTTCREEILQQTDVWIGKYSNKIKKRYEVRLALHKPKYQRIKNIYDKRLQEVHEHQEKVPGLEKIIENFVQDAKQHICMSRDLQREIVNNYKHHILEVEHKLDKAKHSNEIAAQIQQVDLIAKDNMERLDINCKDSEEFVMNIQEQLKLTVVDAIRNIRLFSEGGNYTPEEVKFTQKKLKALHKKAPRKVQPVLKETTKHKSQVVNEMQNLKNSLDARLNTSFQELKFHESIISTINDLQRNIKRQVYDVKFRLKQMEASTNYFMNLATNHLDKFEEVHHSLNECIERITNLSQYLNNNQVQKIDNDDSTYLPKLNIIINDSLQLIEDKAGSFYQGCQAIINKDKIQPTYKDFMEEVLAIYDGYRYQCEISWMECLQIVIEHILDLLQFCCNLYSEALTKYVTDAVATFCQDNDSIRKSLASDKKKVQDSYLSVYRELKEQKRDLENDSISFLNKLEADVVQRSGQNVILVHKAIDIYMNNLNLQFKQTQRSISEFHQNLKSIDYNAILEELISSLMKQFGEMLQLFEDRSKEQHLTDSEEQDDEKDETPSDNLSISSIDKVESKTMAFREFFERLSLEASPIHTPFELFMKNKLAELEDEYCKVSKEIRSLQTCL